MRLLRVRHKTVKYKNRELPLTLCWGEIPYPDVYIGLAGLLLSGELPARLIVVRSPEATAFGLSRFVELDFNAGIFSSDMLDIPLAPSDKMSLRRQAEQFGIIGSHSIMQHVVDVCQILAPSSLPMLLLGETGTGKGLLARYIHALSGRPMDRFISVNCAAIPESLAESVLFGHKKGAFTGAVADQEGTFDAADGGTLGADGCAVAGVFDVAALKDAPVAGKQASADLEVGIGSVCPVHGFAGQIKELLIRHGSLLRSQKRHALHGALFHLPHGGAVGLAFVVVAHQVKGGMCRQVAQLPR